MLKKAVFIGCGSIGRRHIQNLKTLAPDCQIFAVRKRNDDLGAFISRHEIQIKSNLSEAVGEKPDAVFITNPTSLHLEPALEAARSSIPLFIEKPLSHHLDGVDEFLKTCKQNNVLLLMGYKMRFHPAIRLIYSLIQEGKLGRVYTGRAFYGGYLPDWHPWEDYRRMYSAQRTLGGGVILDAIHELDYLYWIMGDVTRVKSVWGKTGPLDMDTEDSAEIALQFSSNAVGTVGLSYLQSPEIRSCEFIGEKGTIRWSSLDNAVAFYERQNQKWTYFDVSLKDPNQIFLDEMNHFLRCIEGKEKPIHTPEDAKRVLEISLLAKASKPIGLNS